MRFILLCFLISQTWISAKSIQLPASMMRYWVSTSHCYANDTNFVACIEALNLIASQDSLEYWIVPQSFQLDSNRWETKVLNENSIYRILAMKDRWYDSLQYNRSQLQNWTEYKEIHRQYRRELRQLYLQTKDHPIDIAALQNELEQRLLRRPGMDLSPVRLEALNVFLSNTKDPHTYLRAQDEVEEASQQQTEVYGGIGIITEVRRGHLWIAQVFAGSPALKYGLRHDDEIIAIDTIKLNPHNLAQATDLVRGPVGHSIKIIVRRNTQEISIKVRRDKIKRDNVESSLLDRKWALLAIHGFEDANTCQEVQNALINFNKNAQVQGLILDLRENGGGLVDQAVCVAGLFVGPKLIAQTRFNDGETDFDYRAETDSIVPWPMVTLVDGNSASAAELLSGALQDYQRSWIVGQKSFGKGSMQTALPWIPGILLFETRARYYLPSGRSTQLVGVHPEIELQERPELQDGEVLVLREKDLYDNALDSLQSTPVAQNPALRSLNQCTDGFAAAKKRYMSELHKSPFRPDYWLEASKDILSCRLNRHRDELF